MNITPDLSKTDLDHLTAKYLEVAGQVDELQRQMTHHRDNATELEQAIIKKQEQMKSISLKSSKGTLLQAIHLFNQTNHVLEYHENHYRIP